MKLKGNRERTNAMNADASNMNREREVRAANGWAMLVIVFVLILGGAALIIYSADSAAQARRAGTGGSSAGLILLGTGMAILGGIFAGGFFTLQPNEARVLVLFGAYKGTVRTSGFHWANPFYSRGGGFSMVEKPDGKGLTLARTGRRYKMSLRLRNLNGDKLKVNDKRGNPIEIAVVVVWKVQDTAQAMFDVDDFENYVRIQSEAAVRHLANCYPYDHGEEAEITLRGNVEEVSAALRQELQARLGKAGVTVEEARLTHLAYAPEIASAMLRRQQAEAVIAARQMIVHGAVSMVEMALRELAEKNVLTLDDERKAAMVSNLMVVLCGESEVRPVVNTGTLYT